MRKRLLGLMITITMLLSVNVFAVETYGGYNIPIDIDINGSFVKCAEKPILIDGTTYLPLRAFSDAIGGTISWDGEERAATMSKDGHTFVFYVEKDICVVDGTEQDYASVIYQNLTFIPVRAISDVLGYDIIWDEDYLTVRVEAPGVIVPEQCKDASYQYEDILYLGKIIQIECGYQPFEVKLAVAGTVMNRVKSSQFPNTVKGVILDTRYGVQFPPAHTDKINVTPSKESIIAAKCAISGVNLVGNALYFIDVKNAPSSWVHNNRPHFKTISGMSFYE